MASTGFEISCRHPRARIFCWDYDVNKHDSYRVSCQYLYDHALSYLCRKLGLPSVG